MDHSRSVTEIKTLSTYVLGKWKLCCCEVCDVKRKNTKQSSQPLYVWNEVKWKSFSRVRLCDTTDSTVHGILQARILEWVATPFSKGFSRIKIEASLKWRFLMEVYEVLKVAVVTHLNDTYFSWAWNSDWTCLNQLEPELHFVMMLSVNAMPMQPFLY